MSNAFKETRNLFREHTNYNKPLSFDEWVAVSDDDKAAILYVQFYDQITLAWEKTKSFYTPMEDGVSTVLQYLMKNVPVILENPSRFTPGYIYKVSYNCLYCICHDIASDRQRWENERSNIVQHGEDELDLFDTVNSDINKTENLDEEEFWSIIENMGLETQKVINYLLNGESLRKTSRRNKLYDVDPLRDVSVSLDEMEEIIENLRQRLDKFKEF